VNELREAMDRLGAPYEPSEDGWGDLARRRTRVRRRRRITRVGLVVAVVAGGSLAAARTLTPPTTNGDGKVKVLATWPVASLATPTTAAAAGPSCPAPSGDSPPPVNLPAASGAAGSSMHAVGSFQTGWLWFQLWWNADGDTLAPTIEPPPWPPTGPDPGFRAAGPGPVTQLAAVAGPATTGDCSFQTTITIPDVDPGIYHMAWAFGVQSGTGGDDGFAIWVSQMTFEVTG
jgi:hypothetical protein